MSNTPKPTPEQFKELRERWKRIYLSTYSEAQMIPNTQVREIIRQYEQQMDSTPSPLDAEKVIERIEELRIDAEKMIDEMADTDDSLGVARCSALVHAYNTSLSLLRTHNTESEWISVKERLPKEKEFVLAVQGNYIAYCQYRDERFYRWADPGKHDRIMEVFYPSITHWQPLPPTTNRRGETTIKRSTLI